VCELAPEKNEDDMSDLIFIAVGLAFFVGCALYAHLCERL
jgi:hypothetical protein